MNILVTGAGGQLGTELRNIAGESQDHYIFSDVTNLPGVDTLYLDITNLDAVRIVAQNEKVDVIVNCAAYTNVDKAEDDMALADMLNHGAPANLARVAKETGATLIHISTDYVFGGEASSPYKEEDEKAPLGVYGATKLAGEKAVIDSGCNYIIFRTAWLYSPYGKNFVKTMLQLTGTRDVVRVVNDQTGSPTYAADLAGLIFKVIEERRLDCQGVYHYTDEGVITWYELACEVNAMSGHDCDVQPCRSDEYPSKTKRPHYSVLDKSKVKETFGVKLPYWKDSLSACMARIDESSKNKQ